MSRTDELGLTQCHFCQKDVPAGDPLGLDWSLVPRYNKERYKGKRLVWRCPRCRSFNKRQFRDWLFPEGS